MQLLHMLLGDICNNFFGILFALFMVIWVHIIYRDKVVLVTHISYSLASQINTWRR